MDNGKSLQIPVEAFWQLPTFDELQHARSMYQVVEHNFTHVSLLRRRMLIIILSAQPEM
jgi:hypothetical protein